MRCRKIFEGDCNNWDGWKLNLNYQDREYSIEECHGLCLEAAECDGFMIGTMEGNEPGVCYLGKGNCAQGNSKNLQYYAMTDCTGTGLCTL